MVVAPQDRTENTCIDGTMASHDVTNRITVFLKGDRRFHHLIYPAASSEAVGSDLADFSFLGSG